MLRGVSYTAVFYAYYADGSPATGQASNITVRVSKDGGTPATTTNSPVEISSTTMPGWYRVTLTASETDANSVLVVPRHNNPSLVFCSQIVAFTELGRVDVAVSSRSTLTTSDVQSALTSQGYTTTRAGYLDRLDVNVSSRMPSGNVTVGGYASGQSPADLVLATPANKLATDTSGRVTVGTNADKSGYSLTAAEHTSIASAVWSATTRTLTSFGTLASDVASAVWSFTIEASHSALHWLRMMGSVMFGKRSVSGDQFTYYGMNDTTVRVSGTVDENRNRNITTRSGS